MLRHSSLALALVLAASTAALGAQEAPLTGAQNPPSVTWDVLRSPRFELIYPRELAAEAQRVARHLEGISPAVARSLGVSPRSLPLVLQNRGVVSNGFVALAPRRSEWLATAPQGAGNLGPNDWFDLLGTHEYRHVVQFEKMDRGFVGFLGGLFGEPGQLFGSDIALPPWFWEGDAVGIETALTSGGRGRIPEFNVEQRALSVDKDRPEYWTAYWRSYGRYVPDHYQLGYAITSWLTLTQGPAAWDSVVGRTADRAWLPWAFSASLREVTGRGDAETYALAMDSLTTAWRAQVAGLTETPATAAHALDLDNFSWTEFPQFTADNRLIALRRGIDLLYGFVELKVGDSGTFGEVTFTPAPYQFGVPHSVGGGRLAYAETVYDARWGQQQWSVVRVRDLATGRAWVLGNESRWFAPALSPDGQRVAVVEQRTDGAVHLLVLDAQTGAEQWRAVSPGNALVQLPRWAPDGRHLVFTRTTRGTGRAIVWLDLDTRAERVLVGPTTVNVQAPVTDGRVVYFVSPRSGVDNVFAVSLADGRSWQVTSRRHGAMTPAVSPDGTTLAFAEMTGDGQQVMTMAVDTTQWVPLARAPMRPLGWAEGLTAKLGPAPVVDSGGGAPYPSEPYRAWQHLLNVYGLTASVSPFSPIARLSLVSRDLLGTTSMAVGVRANSNERTVDVGGSITYAGSWPVLQASLFRNQRRSSYLYRDSASGPTKEASYRWTELDASLGVRLPLNLTSGLYNTFLEVGGTLTARRTTDQPTPPLSLTSGERLLSRGTFLPVTWYLSAGRGYATYRDLQPVWGQYALVVYEHTPFIRSVNRGALLSGRGFLYFPGFARHHGILLEGGYERQWAGNYYFSSQMVFPRGYAAVSFDRFTKMSANYSFPLDYPDVHWFRAVQIQRVRGNVFHDVGLGEVLPTVAFPSTRPASFNYTTSGLELMADTWWWQFPTPVGLGIRTAYQHELKLLRTALIVQIKL